MEGRPSPAGVRCRERIGGFGMREQKGPAVGVENGSDGKVVEWKRAAAMGAIAVAVEEDEADEAEGRRGFTPTVDSVTQVRQSPSQKI